MSTQTLTRKVFVYKRFERFWHWAQALLVALLAITGFEIHGSYSLLGFQQAFLLHNVCAWAFIVLIAFAIFWHFTTGEWKQYLPTSSGKIGEMFKFYVSGIFKGQPHPVKKTELTKFNPLQRLVYLALKILVIPVQVGTGLLYFFYNAPPVNQFLGDDLRLIATIHTIGAFVLIAFLFAHIYLTTTGHTPLSNLKAMLTGWEEFEEEMPRKSG